MPKQQAKVENGIYSEYGVEAEADARKEQKETKYTDCEIYKEIDYARGGLIEGLAVEVQLERIAQAMIAQAMIAYNNMIDARWR